MLDVLRYTRRLKAKECAHLAATIQIAYFNMFGRILGKQNNHGVYPDFKVEHPFFAVHERIVSFFERCMNDFFFERIVLFKKDPFFLKNESFIYEQSVHFKERTVL